MIQQKIREYLGDKGPCSGGELFSALRLDRFELWRESCLDEGLIVRSFGRRYLRLDPRLPDYARLSPSILREFSTYCVVGLQGQRSEIEVLVNARLARIHEISKFKIAVAMAMIKLVEAELASSGFLPEPAAYLLAGDIAYGMAHEEPRPERSTGRLVRGSDIDIVVLFREDTPVSYLKALDESIHREKFRILANPSVNQEIDYVVKTLAKLREQADFDSFKRMVACKIAKESILIHGNSEIHSDALEMLRSRGVLARLDELEQLAEAERDKTRSFLLECGSHISSDEASKLFYSAEESEEFE